MSQYPQRGFILLPVVLAIVLIATIAFLLHNQSVINVDTTAGQAEATQADAIAVAGLAHAVWSAEKSGCAGDMGMVMVPFGQTGIGSYSAAITTPGGTTTAYPDLAVDQDAWIRSDQPTVNNGSSADTYVRMELGKLEYALYRFNLSSLPMGAQINSANAWFYVSNSGSGGAFPEGPMTVHRITADWTEAGVTWDTLNTSFDSAVIATIPAQPQDGVWVQVNLTAQVQAWLNGGEPNFGILLAPSAEGTHGKFVSREGAASLQPYLDVVVGNGPASPMSLSATGTLTGNPNPANDLTRTLSRTSVPVYQSPGYSLLQPGAVDGEDAEIWDQAPNNNYGNAAETWVSSASNDTSRSLLRFNTAAIPAGARILDATLSLRRQSGSGANQPVSAHRVTNSWSEASVTWNERQAGTSWDTAGGDFDSTAVATTPVGPVNQRYEWDITPLVQGWVDERYPNYGVELVGAVAGMPGERFYTSDASQSDRHPNLSVTYSCECGSACMAPQGTGTVMMVVINPTTLVSADADKKALFESWGYTVNIIGENANAAAYMTAAASNDVFYISETVNSNQVGTRIKDVPVGVVSEDGDYNSALGFASGQGHTVGPAVNATDTSHYITAVFPNGQLDIYAAGMEQLTVSGTEAPGLQTLADTGGAGSLAVLDTGANLYGGGAAAGPRVMLPLGRDGKLNWEYLNNNGRLIVQRAIQWGTGNIAVPPVGSLLLVVVDPVSLTTQEAAKKALIESWGYAVNLIDEADNQASYDTALAANDVVFITEDVSAGTVGTKLVNATIGVVTEEDNLSDEFGLSGSVHWGSGTALTVDAAHYITETFTPGILTILTATESLADLDGNLAPDIQIQGVTADGPALVSVEAGANVIAGRTAAGRRVQLPWGGNSFDVNHLNADGLTIMQRAIEWAAGATTLTGPVAHWKLDDAAGDAVDSVGGHDGTLTNGPQWTTGQDGGALDLDGNNDYVNVPHDANLSLTETVTFTAWINPDVIGGSYNTVLAKDGGDSGSNYYFGIWQDELVFGFFAGGFFREVFTNGLSIQAGSWQHIAASFDNPANEVRLYLDGVLVHTGAMAFVPTAVTADLRIGRSPDGEYWRGLLDDVRIYASVLGVAEISAIHDAAAGGGGGGGPSPASCNGTYRDEFNEKIYSGSDGSIEWSTSPWVEVGEFDGPTKGDEQIMNDLPAVYQLRIRDNDNGGEGVERQADLSGAGSAVLSFNYRRMNLDNSNDYVALYASSTGTSGPWTELDQIGTSNDTSYQTYTRDISSFISANTAIRLRSSSTMGNQDVVYFDNVQIQCAP